MQKERNKIILFFFSMLLAPALLFGAEQRALTDSEMDLYISFIEAAFDLKVHINEEIGMKQVFFTHYKDKEKSLALNGDVIAEIGKQAGLAYQAHKHQVLPLKEMIHDAALSKETKLFNELIRFGAWLEVIKKDPIDKQDKGDGKES